MPNLTSLTTNFFPTPNEGFTTTTSGSIDSSTDTTIGFNSVSGLTDGSVFTGLIDPGNAKERAFTGVVDTGGSQITNVKFTTGSNATHTAGATVVDYVTGTHIGQISKGIQKEHNQDGTHGNITATSITTNSLTLSGQSNDGWLATGGTHSVSTGYNAGNRSFTVNTSTDLSSIVSEGMRYRVTRNTTPPTQCADLEASSSHYASVASPTGISFTTTFTVETWMKLESYGAYTMISRWDGTSGWLFEVDASGLLRIYGDAGATYDEYKSYQSVPLNKWIHVAATIDMTGSCTMYFDGVSVPVNTINNGASALVQAGNLELSGRNGGLQPFDGKLADVRVWSDIRTADEIQDNMYAYPSDTTGLVAHFKLNGDFTDASTNGNDLTAQNSAVATNVDNPWNATEYGIITAVSASDIQVFCPEGYGIPNGTLTAPFYSTQSAPYGFPRGRDKWQLQTIYRTGQLLKTGASASTYYSGVSANGEWALSVPIGSWNAGFNASLYVAETGVSNSNISVSVELSDVNNAASKWGIMAFNAFNGAASTDLRMWDSNGASGLIELTSHTPLYLCYRTDVGNTVGMRNDTVVSIIFAECAYL